MIERAYGGTVRGKFHKRDNVPNQDSYLVDNRKYYSLAVVCDGLGSKKKSHCASKKLCNIIKKEVRRCFLNNSLSPYKMIESVQKKYRKKHLFFNLSNGDTTCIFVIVSAESIMLFQVGDGLAVIKSNQLEFLTNQEKDFTNETKSFGKSSKKDWTIQIINKQPNVIYNVLLCTDGISEDILPEIMAEFIEELANNTSGKYKNNKYLINLLTRWPNKYSNDDKTIVVVK